MILRPGGAPAGKEIRGHLRRLVRRIHARWPTTRILIRGDGHYGRAQVMAWCEDNAVDYLFGLPGNKGEKDASHLHDRTLSGKEPGRS